MYIYKITNTITSKIYIGQTIKDIPEYRWSTHKSFAKRNVKSKFYNSIRKYGENNFKFEVIFKAFDIESLNFFESYFIEYFNSISNGYNQLSGGNNRLLTEEIKNKISIAHKQRFENGFIPNNRGKVFNSDVKKKQSIKRKDFLKRNKHPQANYIYCINLDLYFKSASEASYYFGANGNYISRICKRENNSYNGNSFKIVQEYDENKLIYALKTAYTK